MAFTVSMKEAGKYGKAVSCYKNLWSVFACGRVNRVQYLNSSCVCVFFLFILFVCFFVFLWQKLISPSLVALLSMEIPFAESTDIPSFPKVAGTEQSFPEVVVTRT